MGRDGDWRTMTAGEFVVVNFTRLADWPLTINLLTHASLALELLYPILIWVPMARPMVLAGVVVMPGGIAVVSPGLTEFTLAMSTANLAFVSGTWLRGWVADPERPPLRVLFDGACPRCRASMALVTAADPGHVIQPIDLTSVNVQAVHPDLTGKLHEIDDWVSSAGRVRAGFDAVRSICAALPLFWPLALFGHVPGIASLGRSV